MNRMYHSTRIVVQWTALSHRCLRVDFQPSLGMSTFHTDLAKETRSSVASSAAKNASAPSFIFTSDTVVPYSAFNLMSFVVLAKAENPRLTLAQPAI